MTSSDAPQPPGGPLRADQPDGQLEPSSNDQGALPDSDDDAGGSVPPVHHEPEQSEDEAELQEENAESSLDQPSQ